MGSHEGRDAQNLSLLAPPYTSMACLKSTKTADEAERNSGRENSLLEGSRSYGVF
jgi:hypothetical protein